MVSDSADLEQECTHENTADHSDLESRRNDMEDDRAQQEGDSSARPRWVNPRSRLSGLIRSLCSSVDGPRQSTSLSREVEADIEVQEVGEHPSRDSADGTLGDVGEDGVAQLREHSSANTSESICRAGRVSDSG